MKITNLISAESLIAKFNSQGDAVIAGKIEPKVNNSACASYRNMFSVIKLQNEVRKLDLIERKLSADIKHRAAKKASPKAKRK